MWEREKRKEKKSTPYAPHMSKKTLYADQDMPQLMYDINLSEKLAST